jgi:hypothetical protein
MPPLGSNGQTPQSVPFTVIIDSLNVNIYIHICIFCVLARSDLFRHLRTAVLKDLTGITAKHFFSGPVTESWAF